MLSLIRDVLMPAAPAPALIAALLMAPLAEAQESPSEETIAIAVASQLAAQAIPGGGTMPTDGGRRASGADEVATDTPEAPQCRRTERIGKLTIRRCK